MVWDDIPKDEARQMAQVWAIEDARRRKREEAAKEPHDPPVGSSVPAPAIRAYHLTSEFQVSQTTLEAWAKDEGALLKNYMSPIPTALAGKLRKRAALEKKPHPTISPEMLNEFGRLFGGVQFTWKAAHNQWFFRELKGNPIKVHGLVTPTLYPEEPFHVTLNYDTGRWNGSLELNWNKHLGKFKGTSFFQGGHIRFTLLGCPCGKKTRFNCGPPLCLPCTVKGKR